jgi:UDP-3-O-[3-hydroxymyristoyl] N-acetylglucosamine deacetylase
MTIRPAEPDTGILFKRMDVAGADNVVRATFGSVRDTFLGTNLANEAGVCVLTTEHLMSAFWGCGIDNAVVEVDGPEVPAMDGSAAPFVGAFEEAGLLVQGAARKFIRILKPVRVADGDRSAALLPDEQFSVSLTIDFESDAVGRQSIEFVAASDSFAAELGSARTFGFYHEVEELRQNGLALGGSMNNAIVIDGDKVLNEDGLRFSDEFVRHKALDAIGDLYLAGAPIIGRMVGVCSGHTLNSMLLKELFSTPAAWRLEPIDANGAAEQAGRWFGATKAA